MNLQLTDNHQFPLESNNSIKYLNQRMNVQFFRNLPQYVLPSVALFANPSIIVASERECWLGVPESTTPHLVPNLFITLHRITRHTSSIRSTAMKRNQKKNHLERILSL